MAPGGAKSWVLRTVVKGKRCDIGLGSVGSLTRAVTPSPNADRSDGPVATFEQAVRQVHAGREAEFRNEKHRKQWLSSLSGVISTCGSKRVDVITSADVLPVLSPQ